MKLKKMKRLIKDVKSNGPSTKNKSNLKSLVIEESAKERGLNVKRINENLVIVTIDDKELPFEKMNGPLSSVPLKFMCDEKDVSRSFIKESGISVPESVKVALTDRETIDQFIQKVGYPVVIKPKNAARGRGVFTQIHDSKVLTKRLGQLADELGSSYHEILIEKQYTGEDFRTFVVDNQIISVTKRARASVTGNGKDTVLDLINEKNHQRRQNRYFKDYPIPTAKEKLIRLYRENMSLTYKPEKGEKVVLLDESNLSAGGDSIDYTDSMHPDFKALILKAAASIPGLHYGGVDLITEDVTKKPEKDNYVITEIEFSPAPISHYPWEGTPRNMGLAIIDYYTNYFKHS